MEEHGDVVLVQAREALPHVGKATEKSAAWWLSAPLRSNARFFCKTDDDSLVHLSHLRSALLASLEQAPVSHLIFSYIRWRGWLPGFRFQACGGGWGGPLDAIHQMEDPGAGCALAEGPFPQGTGTLTCMSRDLAVKMARSEEFKTFLQVAKARNDMGTPCGKADECAAQKLDVHMWHHEDAGISYNAWRTVLAHGVKAALVHLPEKGWIWPWYHKEIAEKQGSSRGIIMHKVTPELYPRSPSERHGGSSPSPRRAASSTAPSGAPSGGGSTRTGRASPRPRGSWRAQRQGRPASVASPRAAMAPCASLTRARCGTAASCARQRTSREV